MNLALLPNRKPERFTVKKVGRLLFLSHRQNDLRITTDYRPLVRGSSIVKRVFRCAFGVKAQGARITPLRMKSSVGGSGNKQIEIHDEDLDHSIF